MRVTAAPAQAFDLDTDVVSPELLMSINHDMVDDVLDYLDLCDQVDTSKTLEQWLGAH